MKGPEVVPGRRKQDWSTRRRHLTPKEFEEDVEGVLYDAETAFWDVVAKAFPEARTGDMDPAVLNVHRRVNIEALLTWLVYNAPGPMAEAALMRLADLKKSS